MDYIEREIGAFEAKTRLAELLREAERGASYVILRRGKPVARLVPVETDAVDARRQAIEEMQSLRKRIEGKFDVCRLVERERRYR